MTSPAEFLARLGGKIFVRVIWPTKQLGPVPDGMHDTYNFYVTADRVPWAHLDDLNTRGYSIFYGANDPGKAELKENNCETLRLIYRDCDNSAEPVSLVFPEGEPAPPHFHIETSPGKSQSIWLTTDIEAEYQRAIHGNMVANYDHDPQTFGSGRLLRLPGFRNTKYPERPMVRIVSALDLPRLQGIRVLRAMRIGAKLRPLDGNVMGPMNRAQSSDGSAARNLHPVTQERPKRGDKDRQAELETAHEAATGQRDNLKREHLFLMLARIDPDIDRANWFKVGAALHFMFDGSSEGFELFDGWSMLGEKYSDVGSSAPRKLWSGFADGRENLAHLSTIEFLASLQPITPAVRRRLNCPFFQTLRLLWDADLSVRTLATRYPFLKWEERGHIPDPLARGNVIYQLQLDFPELHFSDFNNCIMADPRTPWDDHHTSLTWGTMHENHCRVSRTLLEETLKDYAYRKRRNMAIEYFQQREGGWDGIERLPTVLIRHLGAPDNIFTREMTVLLFVAIVLRTFQPGFKFDMMPIFEGEQGKGKSSLFKRLIPQESWFSDAPRLDLDEKRFYPLIQGKMCIEFAELDGKSRAELGRIKKIITQTRDEYIGMYGRHTSRVSRTAVFIGSTNESRYLRDMSGNRRFPVIPITRELVYREIDGERDQLWAEAVFLSQFYDELRLSDEAVTIMEQEQELRLDLESGVQEILDELEFLGGGLLTNNTIQCALGLDDQKKSNRLGSQAKYAEKQIKDRLLRLGWKQTEKPIWINGRSHRGVYKRTWFDELPLIDWNQMNGFYYQGENPNADD